MSRRAKFICGWLGTVPLALLAVVVLRFVPPLIAVFAMGGMIAGYIIAVFIWIEGRPPTGPPLTDPRRQSAAASVVDRGWTTVAASREFDIPRSVVMADVRREVLRRRGAKR